MHADPCSMDLIGLWFPHLLIIIILLQWAVRQLDIGKLGKPFKSTFLFHIISSSLPKLKLVNKFGNLNSTEVVRLSAAYGQTRIAADNRMRC